MRGHFRADSSVMKRSVMATVVLIPVAVLALSACSGSDESSTQRVVAPSAIATPQLDDLPPIPAMAGDGEQPSPSSGASATAANPAWMGKKAATALVMAEFPEGSLTSVVPSHAKGYEAWAVTVGLPNGGAVVGFVDRESGVVYQWKEVLPPADAAEDHEQHSEHDELEANEHDQHEGEDD